MTMHKIRIAWCIPAVLVCFAQETAGAQGPTSLTQEAVGNYRRATERSIALLRAAFEPRMTPTERAILAKVDISVPSSNNLLLVRATIDRGVRNIDISLGWIWVMECVTDAVILADLFQVGAESDVTRYVEDVARRVEANGRSIRLGESASTIPLYASFVGLRPDSVDRLYKRSDFQDARVALKLHSLAWIIGHEMAHHVLGHLKGENPNEAPLDRATRRRSEESAADAWANKMANGAGYHTHVGVYGMMLYSLLEGSGSDPLSTHPSSLCRTSRAVIAGVDAAMADPDFVKYLRSIGEESGYVRRRAAAAAELAKC